MYPRSILFLTFTLISATTSKLFYLEKLAGIFRNNDFLLNETSNELWHGIVRDCTKKMSFSCIQKNAYAYLDNAFIERDNISVFDGFTLTRNNLNYEECNNRYSRQRNFDNNFIEDDLENDKKEDDDGSSNNNNSDEKLNNNEEEEADSPLEEITTALRSKTVKFLATRNYEMQLPDFFFNGATIKISPRDVDENGALLRVDFGPRAVENQGRLFFKKFRKMIQNKLLMSFLALMLIIKLIKVKFMFVIPFLFGVGTAKKLFLKLLLFLVPAFAHIFKLCSSYYSSHSTKFHHHHHQIAHHHHHVPVPVPVPAVFEHPHHHPPHHHDDFDGYDYAHPNIQYRKDMEELKEWGIEPFEEPYEEVDNDIGVVHASQQYPNPYGISQYAANARPVSPVQEKFPPPPLPPPPAVPYAGYGTDDPLKYNRRIAVTNQPPVTGNNPGVNPGGQQQVLVASNSANPQVPVPNFKSPQGRPVFVAPGQQVQVPAAVKKNPAPAPAANTVVRRPPYDDDYYGPIIDRLEQIFGQLRFVQDICKERLICSMYKNPAVYSPHSNLVSNELSRDPQELKNGVAGSASSQKFQRYLSAARLGQDGGDCLRTYPCHINTE